jgi:PAS domain S-box-containing protein
MPARTPIPRRLIDPDAALRAIAQGTAGATGEPFFRALVHSLAASLDTFGAWVTEYLPERRVLRGLAFWLNGNFVDDYETPIDGTPCADVVVGRRRVLVADHLLDLYPGDAEIRMLRPVAYLGVPLFESDGGAVLGHLAVMDKRPIPPDPRLLAVFEIFAARAAAEHRRIAAEARLRDREEKLAHLVDTAMDAILDLGADLTITAANAAAARVFACPPDRLVGRPFTELLTTPAARTFLRHADGLAARPGAAALWLPDPLDARRLDGDAFIAEASLSRYSLRGRACHTLILRDVNDRLEAQRTIQSLAAQADYLKGELRALHNCDQILCDSPAMRHVLRDVAQVAPTDAAVLVLGETGTGKELVARAIHAASRRKDKPLIRVNCAAIPAHLMESEFFGHEKGAFTGATQRRDGRFVLADGGTLFLDEVGELPVDLQVKLLRALQEGEFEPVGGSKTVKVNVRVVAATNRDLPDAIKAGAFREDLYYRLNVFPIRVPPLRARGDRDLAILARAFTARAAHRVGRTVELTDSCLERLRAYPWPGNVRELENVIERAVITSVAGRLNLDRALPETAPTGGSGGPPRSEPPITAAPPADVDSRSRIHTIAELESFERDNILRALDAAAGRIAGASGAAEMLAINPSTLRSRMKALNIPRRLEA